jgi:Helix-turn-helix domain
MGKQLATDLTQAFGGTGTKLIGRPPDHNPTLIAPRKRAYSVKETAKELSVSIPQIYVLLGRGDLHGKKVGSRTVILGAEIDRYLDSLPDAKIALQKPIKRSEEARSAHTPPSSRQRKRGRFFQNEQCSTGRHRSGATAGA